MKSSSLIQLFVAAAFLAAAVSVFLAPRTVPMNEAVPAAAEAMSTQAEATMPAVQPTTEFYGVAALKKESDGHFWALANVDGRFIKVMVDTGASTVALTYADAEKLGLDPANLAYDWVIRTAGGEVKGASVLLKSVKIGGVEVRNVEAMVLRDGLQQSLLGMTFLGELYSYEFKGQQLILRK